MHAAAGITVYKNPESVDISSEYSHCRASNCSLMHSVFLEVALPKEL